MHKNATQPTVQLNQNLEQEYHRINPDMSLEEFKETITHLEAARLKPRRLNIQKCFDEAEETTSFVENTKHETSGIIR